MRKAESVFLSRALILTSSRCSQREVAEAVGAPVVAAPCQG